MNGPSTTDTIDTERRFDSRFSCNICLEPVLEPVVTQCGHLYCWPCLYQWLEPGMTLEERARLWGHGIVQQRQVNTSRQCCPVCKAECRLASVIPIYVRNEPTNHHGLPLTNYDNNDDDLMEGNDLHGIPDAEGAYATTTNERIPSSVTMVDMTPERVDHHGLRQRLRFRSRDSNIPSEEAIPDRPPANSPIPLRQEPQQQERHRMHDLGPHRASLSHGLAIAVQQALFQNEIHPNTNSVPPLHRRAQNDYASDAMQSEADRATEFLSRLLLMLGSFVILCLLLF
jgi:hypothetical protein